MQALVSYISVTDRITFISSTYYITILSVVSYTYPIIISIVDIRSLVNKVFHSAHMASPNCQVQVSHLMERNKLGR